MLLHFIPLAHWCRLAPGCSRAGLGMSGAVAGGVGTLSRYACGMRHIRLLRRRGQPGFGERQGGMAGRPAKAAALTRAGRRVRARVPAVARLQGRPFERPFAAMAPSLAIERRATRP